MSKRAIHPNTIEWDHTVDLFNQHQKVQYEGLGEDAGPWEERAAVIKDAHAFTALLWVAFGVKVDPTVLALRFIDWVATK